jgi:hypothetical protein
MPSLNRVQLHWTKATRELVRVVAISAVFGTVACYDNPAATAPDRGRSIAAQERMRNDSRPQARPFSEARSSRRPE